MQRRARMPTRRCDRRLRGDEQASRAMTRNGTTTVKRARRRRQQQGAAAGRGSRRQAASGELARAANAPTCSRTRWPQTTASRRAGPTARTESATVRRRPCQPGSDTDSSRMAEARSSEPAAARRPLRSRPPRDTDRWHSRHDRRPDVSPAAAATRCKPRSARAGRFAVEDAELLAVQLDTRAVRVAEVEAVVHAAVRAEVFDAGFVELRLGRGELLRRRPRSPCAARADRLLEGRVSWPGKSKKPSRFRLPMSKKK